MTEAASASGILEQLTAERTKRIHIQALELHGDPHQSAYEAGLAAGREAGYRQGYREGFADGCKMSTHPGGATAEADAAAGTAKAAAGNRAVRLRGLPCKKCGISSYSDEIECPCCGTPKATLVGAGAAGVAEPESKSMPNRRSRRR